MEIQEIKSRLSLSQVLNHYHLKPDKNLRLLCPFHDDKRPSLQVYYKTHSCYCFSTNCPTHGKSMDVIDFIMYKEKCSKHEAILIAKYLIDPENYPLTSSSENLKSSSSVLSRITLLTKMFTYFKNGVHNSKPAKAYLSSRCLDYEQIEVGYNSGQFHHGTRKDEHLIKSCVEYGLLLDLGRKSNRGKAAYKPFGKSSICFAMRNEKDEIVSLYFRSIMNNKDQRHFYLRNPQGLYPGYPGVETKRLILTESIIDAASLLQQESIRKNYGILSLYGTNVFKEEHREGIRRIKNLEEIIFFLNGDEAGNKAVEKYAKMLQQEYPSVLISKVEVPEGEDVNSLLQSHDGLILEHLVKTRKEYGFIFSVEMPIEKSVEKNEKEEPTLNTPDIRLKPSSALNTTNPHHIKYEGIAAYYQIRGFKVEQLDSLKVSLQIVSKCKSNDHRSKVDLYEYKQVKSLALQASERLDIRKDELEKDLSELTDLLETYRDKCFYEKEKERAGVQKSKVVVPVVQAQECLVFLKRQDKNDKPLLYRFNELIGKAGIVGEEKNRLLLFVVASSYGMKKPLHALIQGSSGSGKTILLRLISSLMPKEKVKRYTRVTDNSFYNQDEYYFVHTLLCLEDLDGLKEEAQYALRELQSGEELRTSTSVKDERGNIRGGERIVRGPVASMSCTTKGELYEDNISRCFLVAVDESEAQTQKVIAYQNRLAAGEIDRGEQEQVKVFLQNCMRLLESYEVVNPYASKIQLPKSAHKIRRLNELYQSFVCQITLLNQYQRKKDKQGRLISEKEDLKLACEILFESILLKVDELEGVLRLFFERLKLYVLSKGAKGKDYEFTRFEVRKATMVSKTQQHYYLRRLVELEYLRQEGYANRGYRYRIVHWDNMEVLRSKIKEDLARQLDEL